MRQHKWRGRGRAEEGGWQLSAWFCVSRPNTLSGQKARMLTPAATSTSAELFELYEPLKELYDRLESLSTPLDAFTSASICSGLLEQVWGSYGVKHHGGETSTGPGPSRMRGVERTSLGEEGRLLRGLVNGSRRVSVSLIVHGQEQESMT
jgi:hypothetical protein